MIKPGEIQQKARNVGVRDQQIEKDYVLSWILSGLAQHPVLAKILVFKGGTVLKKAYFEDYRFSEDLDFTLVGPETDNDAILTSFEESFRWVRDEANIPLSISETESTQHGLHFYIGYVGPLGGQGNNKRVKVDITRDEKLVFEPTLRALTAGYSDLEPHQLLCYSLEEILVEKMRSVMQRMQSRDFYDIWYLLDVCGLEVQFYTNEFKAKCTPKELDPSAFLNKLNERIPQYRGRWDSSLSNQIRDLPDFDQVERDVMRQLKKVTF